MTAADRPAGARTRRLLVIAIAGAVAVVVLVSVAVALTGRGGSHAVSVPGSVAVLSSPSSLDAPAPPDLIALTRSVPCPTTPTTPLDSPALKSLRAVTAVECLTETRAIPGDGQWIVAVRQVATAGVSALQSALEQHDQARTSGACAAYLVELPGIALVSASGASLVPTVPHDGCSHPVAAFLQALGRVTWHEVTVTKQRQVVSAAAEAAGCDMQWKNENYLAGQLRTPVSPGGPLFASPPSTVQVCYYRTQASSPDVGTFVRARTLDADQTAQLLAALAGAGSTASCPAAAAAFAVIRAANVADGTWANVELGGCWRVARSYPREGEGSANARVVTTLLGPA